MKLRNKKARKRAQVGRPQREDAPRYAGGRINYAEIRQADRAQATVIDARMRLWGLSEDQAKTPTAGTVFGRMYLQGELTAEQYEAGQQFHARRQGYLHAISAPPAPRSGSDLHGVRGKDGSDGSDEAYTERCNTARRRYADIRRVILDADGFGMFALEQVICDDRRADDERTMGSLRVALNAIARVLKIERGC